MWDGHFQAGKNTIRGGVPLSDTARCNSVRWQGYEDATGALGWPHTAQTNMEWVTEAAKRSRGEHFERVCIPTILVASTREVGSTFHANRTPSVSSLALMKSVHTRERGVSSGAEHAVCAEGSQPECFVWLNSFVCGLLTSSHTGPEIVQGYKAKQGGYRELQGLRAGSSAYLRTTWRNIGVRRC